MKKIGPDAPLGHGFVEKPYTNCKHCQADLDPNKNMMYYCDTSCYYKQNITGENIQTHHVCACETDADIYSKDNENTDYCIEYDAVYCTVCLKWLEPACNDEKCVYCPGRPNNMADVLKSRRFTLMGRALQIKGLPN